MQTTFGFRIMIMVAMYEGDHFIIWNRNLCKIQCHTLISLRKKRKNERRHAKTHALGHSIWHHHWTTDTKYIYQPPVSWHNISSQLQVWQCLPSLIIDVCYSIYYMEGLLCAEFHWHWNTDASGYSGVSKTVSSTHRWLPFYG